MLTKSKGVLFSVCNLQDFMSTINLTKEFMNSSVLCLSHSQIQRGFISDMNITFLWI